MTRAERFSDETIYQLAEAGFLHELEHLIRATHRPEFRDLLPAFVSYKNFLTTEKHRFFGIHLAKRLLKEKRILDFASDRKEIQKLALCANLAAWTEIFHGWTIPVGGLQVTRANEYLQMALSSTNIPRDELGRGMAQRLNNGDTVRVVQILKLLDLIAEDTGSHQQLSLGASIGRRDCYALHLTPSILPLAPVSTAAAPPSLHFSVQPSSAAHTILIDNDPSLQPIYDALNKETEGKVSASNTDICEGLRLLAEQINRSQLEPRTLVAAFRIEPAAFGDFRSIIDAVGKVIDRSADLVMTIGSGDTDDVFRERLQVLGEISDELARRDLKPVRIKTYKGQSLNEQRSKPVFGLNQYASYETLYCRLDRSKLERLI